MHYNLLFTQLRPTKDVSYWNDLQTIQWIQHIILSEIKQSKYCNQFLRPMFHLLHNAVKSLKRRWYNVERCSYREWMNYNVETLNRYENALLRLSSVMNLGPPLLYLDVSQQSPLLFPVSFYFDWGSQNTFFMSLYSFGSSSCQEHSTILIYATDCRYGFVCIFECYKYWVSHDTFYPHSNFQQRNNTALTVIPVLWLHVQRWYVNNVGKWYSGFLVLCETGTTKNDPKNSAQRLSIYRMLWSDIRN